jgi:hypothetical protein
MYALGRSVNTILTGRALAQYLETLNKAQRAILVAEWRAQNAALVDLSLAQWGLLVDVNPGYISKAAQLTPRERIDVVNGRRPLVETNGHAPDIAEVITAFGAEVVAAAALDAMPAVKVAAE